MSFLTGFWQETKRLATKVWDTTKTVALEAEKIVKNLASAAGNMLNEAVTGVRALIADGIRRLRANLTLLIPLGTIFLGLAGGLAGGILLHEVFIMLFL